MTTAHFYDPSRLNPNEPRVAFVTGRAVKEGHACLSVLNDPELDCHQLGMPPVSVYRLVPIVQTPTPGVLSCLLIIDSQLGTLPPKVNPNARSRDTRSARPS